MLSSIGLSLPSTPGRALASLLFRRLILKLRGMRYRQRDPSEIEVLIVPRDSYNDTSERSVIREIRSRLGPEIGIRLRLVNEIAREPNGKFRAVKSAVGRNEP